MRRMTFQRRYPIALQEAVIDSCLDRDYTVARAVRLAVAGELPGYNEGPIDLKLQTAHHWVREARSKRQARARTGEAPEVLMRETLADLTERVRADTQRLMRRRNRAKPDEIRELAKAAREIIALSRDMQRGQNGARGGKNGHEAEGEPKDWIGQLAAER